MRQRVLSEYDRADVIRVMSGRARATFEKRGFDTSKVFVATPPIDVAAFDAALESLPTLKRSV